MPAYPPPLPPGAAPAPPGAAGTGLLANTATLAVHPDLDYASYASAGPGGSGGSGAFGGSSQYHHWPSGVGPVFAQHGPSSGFGVAAPAAPLPAEPAPTPPSMASPSISALAQYSAALAATAGITVPMPPAAAASAAATAASAAGTGLIPPPPAGFAGGARSQLAMGTAAAVAIYRGAAPRKYLGRASGTTAATGRHGGGGSGVHSGSHPPLPDAAGAGLDDGYGYDHRISGGGDYAPYPPYGYSPM